MFLGSNSFVDFIQLILLTKAGQMNSQKRTSRRLRSEGACHPIANPFKTDHYSQILPTDVYNKIIRKPSINCDKINEMVFHPEQNHQSNLIFMRKAIASLHSIGNESQKNQPAGMYLDEIQEEIDSRNREQKEPEEQIIEPQECQQNGGRNKKCRKTSESGNVHYNVFGEQIQENINFFKELDQFLLE